MTSAMPSAANVNRASQLGIHAYDSWNWKRAPPALNAIHMKTLRTSTASDQPNAIRLASSLLVRGMQATTTAPTSGASVRMDRNGNPDI